MATAVSAASAVTRTNAGRTGLADNFETFLSILTTQLRNQDPLSPMDGNQFTQQLVQMSGVEQQLLSNQLLTSLVNQGTDVLGGAVDLIGKQVTADKASAEMVGGVAEWSYALPKQAYIATFEVRNAAGQVVNTWNASDEALTAGRHEIAWDGTVTKDGKVQPDKALKGTYTLSVSAWGADGRPINTPVNIVGMATAAEQIDGEAWLTINGVKVPMSTVTSVRAPDPEPEDTPPAAT